MNPDNLTSTPYPQRTSSSSSHSLDKNSISNSPQRTSSSSHSLDISSTSNPSQIPTDNLHDLLQQALKASEELGNQEMEIKMLREQVHELKCERTKLQNTMTEKEVQVEMLSARVSEIELIAFQAECDRKLLEAERKKFGEERENLLQQIQNLASQPLKSQCDPVVANADSEADSPPVPSYSDVVKWSTIPPRKSSTGKPTQTPPPVQTSNRFWSLADETDQDDKTKPHGTPTKPNATASKHRNKTVQKSRPRVMLFVDSIGKRIDSQRLSRRADVKNLCVGGRKIESVSQDIKESNLANVDTVITHVGTNNLVTDSVDSIMRKFDNMSDTLKQKVPEGCEIAVSSIIVRNDRPDLHSKLDTVNKRIEELCVRNKWTFIDNKAVRDLHKDNLHPNDKGMSYLARNLQAFLRCAHPLIFQQGRKQTYHRKTQFNRNRFPIPLLEDVPMWLKYLMPKNMARMPCRL